MRGKGRLFAVVPAAGRSRRMGRPKLLLRLAGKPVIEHVLAALAVPPVTAIVVVLHRDDEALRRVVSSFASRDLKTNVLTVVPTEPPKEMIISVQHALGDLERAFSPNPSDAWLLALADQPTVRSSVVQLLADRWGSSDREILIPTFEGRRGHPVLFGWSLAADVLNQPAAEGLNQLVRRCTSQVEEVPVAASDILADLDCPEDFARLCGQLGAETGEWTPAIPSDPGAIDD